MPCFTLKEGNTIGWPITFASLTAGAADAVTGHPVEFLDDSALAMICETIERGNDRLCTRIDQMLAMWKGKGFCR